MFVRSIIRTPAAAFQATSGDYIVCFVSRLLRPYGVAQKSMPFLIAYVFKTSKSILMIFVN